jgi:UDP-N-acetylglucosamine 2-epimerase
VAVVTGTRAEFGLLRPVMDAVTAHPGLRLKVIAAGSHFLPPGRTEREVAAAYPIAARVPMQRAGEARTRANDALAVARGVEGFARAFARIKPDWVVVLGDRIEAFAAASAASIAGLAVCHIHGGDRAEGIADEAMRHAITKLSHLHCAATSMSAGRIMAMGERPEHVHVTGSPAIDGLDEIKPMGDREAAALGDPRVVVLLHPSGFPVRASARVGRRGGAHPEGLFAGLLLQAVDSLPDEPPVGACRNHGPKPGGGVGPRGLILEPNHDAHRDAIMARWAERQKERRWPMLAHLPRAQFVALLKRMARKKRGLLVGNSSAGLIECAFLGVPTFNVGLRQGGRERGPNVVDCNLLDAAEARRQIRRADRLAGRLKRSTLFGNGRAGERVASLLTKVDPHDPALLRKRNQY